MAGSNFKAPPPPVVYARSRSRMVGFGIDFHYRFIRGLGREEAFSPRTKRTPYAALDNETSGNESLVGGRVCVGPLGLSAPPRRVSILSGCSTIGNPSSPLGFRPRCSLCPVNTRAKKRTPSLVPSHFEGRFFVCA